MWQTSSDGLTENMCQHSAKSKISPTKQCVNIHIQYTHNIHTQKYKYIHTCTIYTLNTHDLSCCHGNWSRDQTIQTCIYYRLSSDIFKHFNLLPVFRRRLSFFWGKDVKIFCGQGRTFQNILQGFKIFRDRVFTRLHFGRGSEFHEAPPWMAASAKILKL